MKKIISIICVLVCLSCGEKKTAEQAKFSVPEKKELVVKIGLKTSVKDVFKIMMYNVEVDEFQKKNIIVRETIPLTSSFENMTVNFGENNFSNNIQINLGKEIKIIQFNTIEFRYGENILVVTNENFNKFLRLNKFIEYDKASFSIKTISIDNEHVPLIYGRKTLIDFLNKKNE